jgi:hypothetical protein
VEQAHAQVRFQLRDRLADRLRRQAGFDGRLAETADTHDSDEQGNDARFIHMIYNQRVKIKQRSAA